MSATKRIQSVRTKSTGSVDLGVGPSRAGDAFHYRWAARRCLLMINPQSHLKSITVEASKEAAAGESVIDLAEYYQSAKGRQTVDYQQLKHSTVRVNQPLSLSELRRTLNGFGARFEECLSRKIGYRSGEVTFAIVTNRPVSPNLDEAVKTIARGDKPNAGVGAQLIAHLPLKASLLRSFCQSLRFVDRQEDYRAQSRRLKDELQGFTADQIGDSTTNHVIALVQDRVMPNQPKARGKGEIRREDVLQRLNVSAERDLFPAPPQFESVGNLVPREQHSELETAILSSYSPIIIHATGGVGKSVVAQQLVVSLSSNGSLALAFDCFGGGNYRNQAEPRHRPCDAFVQIVNELATHGLCQVLLAGAFTPPDALLRSFRSRLEAAISNLRMTQPKAQLVVIFDAADNAEMAAEEFGGERCFANAVMRLELPDGCHIVAICRTERIGILQPRDDTLQIQLLPFSELETTANLRREFPNATDSQILRFHRLSSGNPRVQANALIESKSGLDSVLLALGPGGTTVSAQIQVQLQRAISSLKSLHGDDFANQVDAICVGLASLPPNIPLEVLAKAAAVDVATIRSFVSDLGRPLWLSGSSVHFKDEPTETWFSENFGADPKNIKNYISALEPFAASSTYVAQALPKLLLRAGEHDRLLSLALTDELLPTSSPVETREIRVYRLQYAFKAALKLERLLDASRLAFRAGEEVAGDERQFRILRENPDLVFELHEEHRVQDLAMSQSLRSAWDGSSNLYSASLLCRLREFRGNAGAFLESAQVWLRLYFDARDQEKNHFQFDQKLNDEDCAEFAWVLYHIKSPAQGVESLLSWKPPEFVYRTARIFVRRLVDLGRVAEINRVARLGSENPHLMIAVTEQLMALGLAPPAETLLTSYRLLSGKNPPIKPTDRHGDQNSMTLAVIAFAEACALRKLPKTKILRILSIFSSTKASNLVGADHQHEERSIFVRSLALRVSLMKRPMPEISKLLPKPRKQGSHHYREEETRKIKDALGALLPWQHLRARLLVGDRAALKIDPQTVASSSLGIQDLYGRINQAAVEASLVCFQQLSLRPTIPKVWVEYFKTKIMRDAESRFRLCDRLTALRTACRRPHLQPLGEILEESCRRAIEQPSTEGPEEKSSSYLALSRAVFPESKADARAYFGEAIDVASKFGDEMLDRWHALGAIARQSSSSGPLLAYRYIQVAETVGESVAREKHWEREDVFRVLVHLDAPSAAAGLSRWRDRSVGWYEREVHAFVSEAFRTDQITSSVAWSMTGFKGLNASLEHAIECLRAENSTSNRVTILKQAVRDLRLANASVEDWELIKRTANELALDDSDICSVLSAHALVPARQKRVVKLREKRYRSMPIWSASKWRAFFRDADFKSTAGLTRVLDKFFSATPPKSPDEFWPRFFDKVPRGREQDCLEGLIACEHAGYLDIGIPLRHAKVHWLRYKSVSRAWENTLQNLGRRHAVAVCSYQRMLYFSESYGFTEQDILCLKSGAVDGLRESPELVTASTFFGFASHSAKLLRSTEARQVLGFALSRFEVHVDPASGDGPWQEQLRPPTAMTDAIAELIWSALASPYSSTRWQAIHVVRRLVSCGCSSEVSTLVVCYDTGGAKAFRSEKFPFYLLHARLYLLVGLARAAQESPQELIRHRAFFVRVAVDSEPHILLQHFARESALALERASPGTYPHETLSRLAAVNSSPFPILPRTEKDKHEITPWHLNGELAKAPAVNFGIDFPPYWFDPLARVFGLKGSDVCSLVGISAVNDLGVPSDEEYHPDPRGPQFERVGYSGGGTRHSHGSYPRDDDQSFYRSYHSMLIAAGRLLSTVPVRLSEFSDEVEPHPWDDWLDRHLSVRRDGRWVSDRRDPKPLVIRNWVREQDSDLWDWQISSSDFNSVLRDPTFMKNGFCVHGDWSEVGSEYREREETFMVRSALVSPEHSESLARAFRESPDPRSFHLPDYEEDRFEIDSPPFELKGWINRGSGRDDRMDALDPYALGMYYPGLRLGSSIEQKLGLAADPEGREWRDGHDMIVVRSRIWAKILRRSGEDEPQTCHQVFARVSFLREMCAVLQKHLVIQVRIERNRHRDYRSESYGERVDIPPSMKIFILKPHGNLHENQRSYRIG